jgi:hypothetical protein
MKDLRTTVIEFIEWAKENIPVKDRAVWCTLLGKKLAILQQVVDSTSVDNVVAPAPTSQLEPTQVEQLVTTLEWFVQEMIVMEEIKDHIQDTGGGRAFIEQGNKLNESRSLLTETLGGVLGLPVSKATKSWIENRRLSTHSLAHVIPDVAANPSPPDCPARHPDDR